MNECLELAQRGLGNTYPNPLVGSVVVSTNKVIGSGWHQKAGEAHAEVHAIRSVLDTRALPTSTLYVNLEPCSHHGKTPPCTDLIIQSGIRHVVVGMLDPFEKVNGQGVQKLRDEGIRVDVGVEEESCKTLNKRFLTAINSKRPYVILKWAQTKDGYIAPKNKKNNKPVWISNSISRTLAHQWRAEEQSILIGSQTAVDDNPSLTTRRIDGPSPTRILIDPNEKINRNAKLFAADQKVIVYTNNHSRIDEHIYYVSIDFSGNGLKQILSDLHLKNIQSVLVEGGTKTLQYFIDAGVWDEAKVFTGQGTFGDGVLAPDTSSFTNATVSVAELNGDVLEVWVNLKKHQ
jgi:diaminohydroxyphosphoribosylaminopyrimidine deaminase/5-amino-6-(5-phosphoribosylamino)uracil reductase